METECAPQGPNPSVESLFKYPAHKRQLQRCKVKVNARCEICSQHLETPCHLLWECPFARNVWSMASRRIQKCSNSVSDFFELFRTMITRLNQQDLETWAVIVWALWNTRNKFYFEKTQLQPRQCQCFGSLNRLARQCQCLFTAAFFSYSWPLFY